MAGCTPTTTTVDSSLGDANDFPVEFFTYSQLIHGAILVHVIASIYVFYVMFMVCDEYLVPAIESLCEVLNLPSHIAGASFLAAASSIPELFVNIIGTFLTQDDLGIGTILASAFFNLLVIAALTGLGTAWLGTTTPGVHFNTISLWPLSRDAIAYSIALISLVVVVWDQKVYWYEALVLVAIYFLYIYCLTFNHKLEMMAHRFGHFITSLTKKSDEKTPILEKVETEYETTTGAEETDDEKDERKIAAQDKQDRELILKALQEDSNVLDSERTQGKWTQFYPPKNGTCFDWIHFLLMFPARFLIILTIPDCRGQTNRSWFPCTLFLAVAWMGSLSYIASWMLTRIGATLGFPNAITGIFLAFGASFPEILSSFIVARKGFGNMGLSNPIGSNTFDILICLGLPWLFQGLTKSTKYVQIYSGGIYITVFLLLLSLLFLYLILLANKMLLDLNVAVVALIVYIVMMTIVCLLEMNILFIVNPKTITCL